MWILGSNMKIAILGASSEIAKDLIFSMRDRRDYELILYGRCLASIVSWLKSVGLRGRHLVCGYEDYGVHPHEVVINFIGVGDPARAERMGEQIFDITYNFDKLVLDDLKKNPNRKYLFLSSGSVYGSDFNNPVNSSSKACVNINFFTPQNYYPLAKLYAECRHRALKQYNIVDLRVFNYFSKSQNLTSRFLITDIIRALRDNLTFTTSSENILRDFLHPEDFFQLVCCILDAPPQNCAIDCYSADPIDKMTLLKELDKIYNLNYEIINKESSSTGNATGAKFNYYSKNLKAAEFNYAPIFSSLTGILTETSSILNRPLPIKFRK